MIVMIADPRSLTVTMPRSPTARALPRRRSRSGPVPSTVVTRLRDAGCVFAEDEAALLVEHAGSPEQLDDLVAQRAAGTPLEHVVGWAEFAGLRVAVGPGVFVPRRRSELLAAETLAVARRAGERPVVVELCCGAGAIAAAVTTTLPRAEVHAVDIDEAAVTYARRNLPAAQVYRGDLYGPLPSRLRGRLDVIVANAPYVPSDEIRLMPAEARHHEPRVALDGGADGVRSSGGSSPTPRCGWPLAVTCSSRPANGSRR